MKQHPEHANLNCARQSAATSSIKRVRDRDIEKHWLDIIPGWPLTLKQRLRFLTLRVSGPVVIIRKHMY